jgi:L-2-hydroxyglutarate oxidase LhgO
VNRDPEVAVIGAGIVGLACGAALARRGRRAVLLERHASPGQEISSRNSQVIHAGLYYPTDSLKAQCCVEGRERLYSRCELHGIAHRRTGKLVVASEPGEIEALERLARLGRANGAGALELVDAGEVTRREPRVRAHAGLWSPESGIVDVHELLSSYQAELESLGSEIAFHTRVEGLERDGALWRIETRSQDGERFALRVPCIVNAAGLEADRIAALAGLDTSALGYDQHLCKGDYFSVAPALGKLTNHLVYPVPAAGGLGIHVTVDLGGRFRLGPDIEYVEEISYAVDPAKAESFAHAVRRYLPEIDARHLSPEMAGIRPKLQEPGGPVRDFVIAEESRNGAPGMVNLIGIESPGLTSAAAIAERVVTLI